MKTASETKRIEKSRKMRTSVKACVCVAAVTLSLCIAAISVYASGAWRGGYYNMKCDIFRRENKSVVPGKTVFVGDSITDFCDISSYYPDTVTYNRGVSADTTDGLLGRMDISIFDLEPAAVVLLIGINDLHIQKKTPAQVAENYVKIFARIRSRLPDTRLIVQSVYPVLNLDFKDIEENCSAGILELNRVLTELSKDYGATYVDIYSVLNDGTGRLIRDLTDDGLHPNADGYRVVADVLGEYLK